MYPIYSILLFVNELHEINRIKYIHVKEEEFYIN